MLSFLLISLMGCLDPKINVSYTIEYVGDTGSSSSQPESEPSSSQPESEPSSSQPSNEPSAQPSNEPSAQPSNEPSNQPQPSNEPSSQPSNEPSNQPSNEPSNQPSNEPSNQPTNEPSNNGGNNGGNNNGGSTESFDAQLCEEWLTCATNGGGPPEWDAAYGTPNENGVNGWCFNNHNNVTDPDNITWFECIESNVGDCSAVVNCGEPSI